LQLGTSLLSLLSLHLSCADAITIATGYSRSRIRAASARTRSRSRALISPLLSLFLVSVVEMAHARSHSSRCDRCSLQLIRPGDKARHLKSHHTRVNPRWRTTRVETRTRRQPAGRLMRPSPQLSQSARCLDCLEIFDHNHLTTEPIRCDKCLKTSCCK
jgi:hypothetical protein